MATPKICTDGTTAFEEAAMNKYIGAGEANHPQTKCWFARLRYTGSAWEVVSTTDAAGLTSGALAWATNQLQLTLSGFVNPPVILATPVPTNSVYNVKAYASTNVLGVVRFYNVDTGAHITSQSTDMDVNVLIIGY